MSSSGLVTLKAPPRLHHLQRPLQNIHPDLPTHGPVAAGDAERIFQQAIMNQGQGQVTRNVLAQITERSKAVRSIEAGMLELHQIFLDLAMLVEAQGRTLDSIQANVSSGQCRRGGLLGALLTAQ
jgi:hypothetical protein